MKIKNDFKKNTYKQEISFNVINKTKYVFVRSFVCVYVK